MFKKDDDFSTTLKKLKAINAVGSSKNISFNDDDDADTTIAKLKSINLNRKSLYKEKSYLEQNNMSPMKNPQTIGEMSTSSLISKKKDDENKISNLRTSQKELLESKGIRATDKGSPEMMSNYKTAREDLADISKNKTAHKDREENQLLKLQNIKDEDFNNKYNENKKELYNVLTDKALTNQELNYRKAQEEAEDSSVFSKIVKSPLLGAWNKFSNYMNDDLIYDENGRVTKAKTYGELLNEESRKTLGGFSGFLYDVGNLAGETATQFIPYVGQANYFADIAMDKYNDNLKSGYSVGDAFFNATGVSLIDYAKQKLLGSLGSKASKLSNGTEKTLENAFEKGFSKIISNKNLNKILSGTSAEFLDEFTDSIVEQIWDNVTLNKNGVFEGMDNPEFWLQAGYEGLLGAITGGGGATINIASTPKSQKIAEQSIYEIERETGNPLSQNNKNIINNISSAMDMTGNKYTAQQVIDRYNSTREDMINRFTKDSVNLFPDLDEQHKTQYYQLINEVAQIMHDTGTEIRFDPNQNTVIDTTGGIISLNPTLTDMPIKNVLLHEIAKNIGGQNTQNYVINKLKKDGTYEQRKNELLATGEFDEANVNNEIVAQELDKILSNEEMLKELANKDTNLFNNIKEKIDFLASKLTNGKNTKDAYYLNALYNNFQRDYGISTTPNKDYVSEIKPKEDDSTTVEEKPLKIDKNGATSDNKQQQLDIINKSNPAPNETNTWIRNKEDINTFKEAYNTAKAESEDSGWENYASYPDITNEMVNKALETGKITVYSSYPIENGVFVTPSYQQALDYAGNDESKVNSKEVNLDDVAWINLDEGQYAKVEAQPKQEFEKQNVEGEGTETRKTYESVIKSEFNTKEEKEVAKKYFDSDKYVPDSNKKELERADKTINRHGVEDSVKILEDHIESGRIDVNDVAVAERLIEYGTKIGDTKLVEDAMQLCAMAGTISGRTVQAMAMLYRMTPTGQMNYIQKTVDKLNKQMKDAYDKSKLPKKKLQQFDFTENMKKKILNSTKENLTQNVDAVYQELGQQVPMSALKKFDTWRYFAMLSSPTTHIRNIVGNASMGKIQGFKNIIRGGIEDLYYGISGKEGERTATLRKTTKEAKEFAINDFKNEDVQNKLGIGDNKYLKPVSQIERYQRMFKKTRAGNIKEAIIKKGMIDKVNNLLEAEDAGRIYFGKDKKHSVKLGGLESAYIKSLSKYITANNLDVKNMSKTELKRARDFAIDEAKQATFHQDNALASAINTIEEKNLFSKVVVGGLIPFKKTPLNVAKTALEYNPLGLVKTLSIDGARLANGKITANQFIDNLSKGLTGTAIAVLGYALADAGIIRTSGEDDDEYDTDRGVQPYSLIIGDKSYTLDWLSPTAVPMFVGAEFYNQTHSDNSKTESEQDNEVKKGLVNLGNSFISSLNPVSEMTMLSGLQSALQSYSNNKAVYAEEVMTNTLKSYAGQIVPSVLGKIAKSTDKYERSTTSTKKTTVEKAIDSFKNQTISKIPGLRTIMLPVKTDAWGNEIETNHNIFYNLFSPSNVKEIRNTELDKELQRLYEATGDSSVLPKSYISKELTYEEKGKGLLNLGTKKEKTYRMTNSEYASLKSTQGENTYKMLDKLIKSSAYKSLSNTQKQEVVKKIFTYNNDITKQAYAKLHNINYETNKKTEAEIESLGGNVSDYYVYNAITDNKDTSYDKSKKLKNLNISNKSKSAIYEASTSKNTTRLYNVLKDYDVDINEYLDYLSNEFESDKDEDGNTVKNSLKNKIVNYFNDESNLTYAQKLLVLGRKYTLNNNEQQLVFNLINNSDLSSDDKMELLSSYKGFKVDNDGNVRW